MAVYRNAVARALGLSYPSNKEPRLVAPGETFEASPSEVPSSFLAVGDIILVRADEPAPEPEPEPKSKASKAKAEDKV